MRQVQRTHHLAPRPTRAALPPVPTAHRRGSAAARPARHCRDRPLPRLRQTAHRPRRAHAHLRRRLPALRRTATRRLRLSQTPPRRGANRAPDSSTPAPSTLARVAPLFFRHFPLPRTPSPRALWTCGRALRAGARPSGRVDGAWTRARTPCRPERPRKRGTTPRPHSRASRPQGPQGQLRFFRSARNRRPRPGSAALRAYTWLRDHPPYAPDFRVAPTP